MSKKDKLPETIFVTRHTEDDFSWLSADGSALELFDGDEETPLSIGIYKLVETHLMRRSVAVVVEE